jgi:hypothetical protein
MLVSAIRGDPSQITTRLMAAIDELLDVDVDTLADTEVVEAVVQLHRQQARLAAAVTG